MAAGTDLRTAPRFEYLGIYPDVLSRRHGVCWETHLAKLEFVHSVSCPKASGPLRGLSLQEVIHGTFLSSKGGGDGSLQATRVFLVRHGKRGTVSSEFSGAGEREGTSVGTTSELAGIGDGSAATARKSRPCVRVEEVLPHQRLTDTEEGPGSTSRADARHGGGRHRAYQPQPLWVRVARGARKWTPLVVLLPLVSATVQLLRPLPEPELSLDSSSSAYPFAGLPLKMPWPAEGQGAVAVDGVGEIGTYGTGEPGPIASVAKVMTAYVLLQKHPLAGDKAGPDITVDATAEAEGRNLDESRVPVQNGEVYSLKQMLQVMLLPSANNVARLLARWEAGSEARFVEKMNLTARRLGMTDTTYTDPSGLKATTVSTAVDQVKLARAAMRNEVFRKIVDSPHVTLPGSVGRVANGNTLLARPGVTGVKTGSSTPAGGNLLWAADAVIDREKHRIVGMVMGVGNAGTLQERRRLAIETYSRGLIEAAQESLTSATVIEKGDVVGHVESDIGDQTPVVATEDLKVVGWPGLQVQLRLARSGKDLLSNATAGTVVGEALAGEGPGAVRIPVALSDDLVRPGLWDRLTRLD
jgi:D-alanyl-D-alanine carboxypeptidase